MQIRNGDDMKSDSARTAMDRYAVNAAGQLLISVIWMEHRVRRAFTRLSMLPHRRAFVVPGVKAPVAQHPDSGRSATNS
jgi:hypothetical protein